MPQEIIPADRAAHPVRFRRIELPQQENLPLTDLAGWNTVLYRDFSAAELLLQAGSPEDEIEGILAAAEQESFRFLLIDLDQHPAPSILGMNA